MTIEQLVIAYAVVFCIFLIPLIWLLLKRRAEKKVEKAKLTQGTQSTPSTPERKPINWGAVLALRPHAVLSGEMWLKTLLAAAVALSAGVIVVVYVFPLGALWAASAAFVAVLVIVVLMFMLLE
jgi:hypothetical protein